MDTSIELLSGRTVRELGAVARCYGLPFNTRRPKAIIHAQLADQLRGEKRLRKAYRGLSPEARDALQTLQTAGGEMALRQFSAYFGPIRPYRPWDADAPRTPFKQPISIAETLWYRAFIEVTDDRVLLCEDVRALLPLRPKVHPVPNECISSSVSSSDLLVDMAAFLGMVAHAPIRLVYGRFLPPNMFRTLNQRLQSPEPGIMNVRSERHVGRARWIHYLAICAGLVDVSDGQLRLNMQTWTWLDATPDTQWACLQTAIQNDLAQRDPWWKTFDLPTVDLDLWRGILEILKSLTVGEIYQVRSVLRALRIIVPNAIAENVRALFAGPFYWMGLTVMAEDGKRVLVNTMGNPAFKDPCGALLWQDTDQIYLRVPEMPLLRPLVELFAWATLEAANPLVLRVDCDAVRRGVQSGLSEHQIVNQIGRLTAGRLPSTVFEHLQNWAQEGAAIRLTHLHVLHVSDSAVLRDLMGDRVLRKALDKPISWHHVPIKTGMEQTLVRGLERRGLLPNNSHQPTVSRTASPLDMVEYTWLAMRVYQGLGALFPQEVTVPGAMSDQVKATLDNEQQDRLEGAAHAIIEQIKRVLHGDVSPFAEIPLAQNDPAGIQSALEDAYEQQESLTIDYFSPAHGYVTRRRITPTLPIRWQGVVGYVEAWCELEDAPRTFRLDRILRIVQS